MAIPLHAIRAEFIVNGDFEASTLSPWTVTGNVFLSSTDSLPTFGNFVNFNAFDSTPNGTLSQSFTTTTAQSYSLSFQYGWRADIVGGSQAISVELFDTATQSLLSSLSIFDNSGVAFLPYNLTFTAIGAQTRLRFTDKSTVTVNVDGLLDNVSVRAVPEPASLVMLATGACGLLGYGRCRRRPVDA